MTLFIAIFLVICLQLSTAYQLLQPRVFFAQKSNVIENNIARTDPFHRLIALKAVQGVFSMRFRPC